MTRALKITPLAPLTGPEMQAYLKSAGIEAQKVVRRRDTGYYVADFFIPGMDAAVQPSAAWAERIRQRLDGLTIVNMSDTIASWRAEKPIIWASVTFAFSQPQQPETWPGTRRPA